MIGGRTFGGKTWLLDEYAICQDLLVFCWACRYEALSLNQKQKRWRGFGRIFYDAETAEHVAGGETTYNIEFQQLKGVLMGEDRKCM